MGQIKQPTSQDSRLADIEHAKVSSVALGVVSEPIEAAKQKALSRLISMYRANKTDHDVLVGIAAELSALDGLVKELENDVRRGETAFQKEHDYGKDY